jgi:BirA family biotin operon repressor/biotin-[acetyl-CoA-carboxylase] ligase
LQAVLDESVLAKVRRTTRFCEIRWFSSIDSTNSYAVEQARKGAPEGLVVVADYQSAGRGRLGRSWTAPPGSSLLMSVLLRPAQVPLDRLHLLTAVMSLAAADACQDAAHFRPDLKWPNDLMVGERKLAGILAEIQSGAAGPPPGSALGQAAPPLGAAPTGNQVPEAGPSPPAVSSAMPAVVVGIGINVNWPDVVPAEVAGTAIAASEVAGRPVDRGRLLASVLLGLETRCRLLESAGGTEELVSEYRRSCATIGRRVTVQLGAQTIVGVATDVDDSGHLVVRPDGSASTVDVLAGDVVHLREQEYPA